MNCTYSEYVYVFTFLLEVAVIANKDKDNTQINEHIRYNEMMVIGPNGEQMGIKSKQDALTIASFAGLDLVLMSEGATPVCKIIDYNKYRYEKQKKEKDAKKRQRESNLETKEYRLSVNIDVHDFDTKARNASQYLEKGHKVKVVVVFKGRQMAHTEIGKDVILKFADKLSDVSVIEQQPKLEGRRMNMLLAPKK